MLKKEKQMVRILMSHKDKKLFYDILAKDTKYFPTLEKKTKAFNVSKVIFKDKDYSVLHAAFSKMTKGKILLFQND